METVSGKNSKIGVVPIEISTACPLKRRVLIGVRGESSAVEGKQGDCKIKKGCQMGSRREKIRSGKMVPWCHLFSS